MKGIVAIILFILVVNVNYREVTSGVVDHGDVQDGENNIDPGTTSFYLTPWELSVLSELYIELSLLRCPAIQKSTARSFKKFIVSRMSLVERSVVESMGAQFFVVYQNLVGCLTDLESRATVTKSHPDDPDVAGLAEADEIEERRITAEFQELLHYDISPIPPRHSVDTSTSTTAAVVTSTAKPLKRDHSIFATALAWFSKIFGVGGSRTSNGAESDPSDIFARTEDKRGGKERAEDIKTDLARRDFHTMIEMFTLVVINSCPIKFQPNPQFTVESIEEIVAAITLDLSAMTKAADFYFRKHPLWRQVQLCTEETSYLDTNRSPLM